MLLASLTYAVAALRMARRGALAQQLNAIESLASVDVVCLDKTGTLTESALRVTDLRWPRRRLRVELGRYAASATVRNATLEAIADRLSRPSPQQVEEQVPFSSRRRFGAQRIGGVGYVLGAPEHFELNGFAADGRARRARRDGVCSLLGTARPTSRTQRPGGRADSSLLAERLRPDARTTVDWFRKQGVELKVLSGDRPETVASIARDAGIEGAASMPLRCRRTPASCARMVLEARGARPYLPARQTSRHRGAPCRRPLRRDGWRRRQRRSRAQSGPARDRSGQRHPDGAQLSPTSCSSTATSRRAAWSPRAARSRNVQRVAKLFVTNPPSPPSSSSRSGSPHRLPAAATPADLAASLRSASPASFSRSLRARAATPAGVPARLARFARPGRNGRRARRALQLPVRAQRSRPRARRGPHRRRDSARPRRALPDPRARVERSRARTRHCHLHPLHGAPRRLHS